MGLDEGAFREGMRRLAASVTVLTTRAADDTPVGLTATAVCSVSANPPVLLCCMNKSNASFAAFSTARHFAVNVLAEGEPRIATRFATAMAHAERFAEGTWLQGTSGSPILADAVAAFDCEVVEHADIGSHRVFFGKVIDVRLADPGQSTLLYAHGGYGRFEPVAASS